MYDDRYARRQARAERRQMRRGYRYNRGLGGLAGGFFFIGLALAFAFSHLFGGAGFLLFLFAGLAFSSLFGSASSMNPRGLYGGLQGFVWLMGLGILFVVGFWPWILVLIGISAILGTLMAPITAGLMGMGMGMYAATRNNQPQQTYQEPYQQYQQPYPQEQQPAEEPYTPYQQGYQPPQAPPGTYQEGGQYQYPQPKQEFEQPGTQRPQELPPQQQ